MISLLVILGLGTIASYLVEHYWGSKGKQIVWLLIAIYGFYTGIEYHVPLAALIGLGALWMARPHRFPKSGQ
jgi:hypothetical protein